MTNAEKYLKDGVNIEELIVTMENELPLSYVDVAQFWGKTIKPTLTEDEKVKEMVYTKERKIEVLATGYYFGLLYYVLSLGTHPTAYVKIPKDNWLCTVKNYYDIPVECHGGLTFRDDHLYISDNQKIEGEFIGWDYAHCGDYAPYYEDLPCMDLAEKTKKWTTHEILKEVKEVCSQIVELGKKLHLTEDEMVILKSMDKRVKYITRDKSGYLYITEKPSSMLALPFSIYNHLFQFIKERRRIFNRRIIRR